VVSEVTLFDFERGLMVLIAEIGQLDLSDDVKVADGIAEVQHEIVDLSVV
jgi:hypothetical protein